MNKSQVFATGALIFLGLICIVFLLILPRIMVQGGSITENLNGIDAKLDWFNQKPFSLINFTQKGTELTLVIKNNSENDMTLERVCVNQTNCDSEHVTLTLGGTIVKIIETDENCQIGYEFNFVAEDIFFEYCDENGEKLVQLAENPLIGFCS
jgi:predicted PurR-regulated permease PerM